MNSFVIQCATLLSLMTHPKSIHPIQAAHIYIQFYFFFLLFLLLFIYKIISTICMYKFHNMALNITIFRNFNLKNVDLDATKKKNSHIHLYILSF